MEYAPGGDCMNIPEVLGEAGIVVVMVIGGEVVVVVVIVVVVVVSVVVVVAAVEMSCENLQLSPNLQVPKLTNELHNLVLVAMLVAMLGLLL